MPEAELLFQTNIEGCIAFMFSIIAQPGEKHYHMQINLDEEHVLTINGDDMIDVLNRAEAEMRKISPGSSVGRTPHP